MSRAFLVFFNPCVPLLERRKGPALPRGVPETMTDNETQNPSDEFTPEELAEEQAVIAALTDEVIRRTCDAVRGGSCD